jgi:hypothetical protein
MKALFLIGPQERRSVEQRSGFQRPGLMVKLQNVLRRLRESG